MIRVTQLECDYDTIMDLINKDVDKLFYVYTKDFDVVYAKNPKDFTPNLWGGHDHNLPYHIVSMTTIKTLRRLLDSKDAIFFKVEEVNV